MPVSYTHLDVYKRQGFQGKTGVMPPKGGRMDVPDAVIKEAVDHMVQMAQ